MVLVQRAQQPALLERAVGRVGAQELPKDQGLGLRHLPHDGGDGVALQPPEAADALVAVDDHIRRARRHDHDGHLLAGIGQRGQQAPFAGRLLHAQPLVPHLELLKLQLHGPSPRWRYCGTAPVASCRVIRGSRPPSPIRPGTYLAYWSCATHGGSRPASSVGASGCPAFWSCATTSKTRPRWPRKSVPAIPNSSWARSHGSCESGGGSTNGKTAAWASSAFSRRRWMRCAMK